jgi:hypothetical protein
VHLWVVGNECGVGFCVESGIRAGVRGGVRREGFMVGLCLAGGGGREACYHAACVSACARLANSGSAVVLSIDNSGARACHRGEFGAHQGDHHGAGGSVAEFQG